MTLGPHHIGTNALIEPGCEIFSRTRRDSDDYPIGGIVLSSHAEWVDDDQSESRLVYLVVDPRRGPRPHFARIPEDDIDRETTLGPNTSRLVRLIRRFCADVAARKGPITPEEADLVDHVRRLMGAVYAR